MMIRLTSDLMVSPDDISTVAWDRRSYVNGPGPSYLVVTMRTGVVHRIEHTPHFLDGVDCYAIEKRLIA